MRSARGGGLRTQVRSAALRVALGGALFSAVTLGAPPLHAQTKPQAPLRDSLSGAARAAYESATILINNGDFAGALGKYEQAYAASHDPRLLFNMAVCARSLRAYARMRGFLGRYRKEAAGTMSEQDKAEVNDALGAIRGLVAFVKLTADQDGATVTVDGEPAGTTPLADDLVIDLGKHVVALRKQGFEPIERSLDISGGDRETALSLTLVPVRTGGALVVSSDDSAVVTLDETIVRRGRFDGEVAAGVHHVRVTEPGKVPYVTVIEIHTGETRTLVVALENEHGATAWPWIVAGAAVVVGAGVGGYFLFQTHPAASGPLPSGQLGAVQFASWRR